MNKKSKKLIILLCLVVIALALGVGGYSYAKYTTTIRGTGRLDVAKWSFKVGDGSEEFETIHLYDTIDESFLANGKIAPGTRGEFIINIDGTDSEVGINYEVVFANEQNKPTNLTFTYNGQEYNSLADISNDISGIIYANEDYKIREIIIEWDWKYETGEGEQLLNNDYIDTQEGINDLDYTFDVFVTGTQIAM